MNSVNIIGRLTKQAEIKYTQSGTSVASFTLAVDRPFKNAQGEKETDFINFVAWKHTAEAISNFTNKGHRVGVTGRVQVRNYENNEGKRVYVTEIVAEQVTFLEPKGQSTQTQNKPNTEPSDPFSGSDIDDGSLPF